MCSAQYIAWSVSCADAGAGSGAVCSVQRAMFSVQCPASHRQRFSTSNEISLFTSVREVQCFRGADNASHILVLSVTVVGREA